MKKASDFLTKFNKLTPPDDALRRAVMHAVQSVTRVPITKADVRIHNGIAFISVSSVAKNKIRLERRAVLDLLFERMPKAVDSVRDIR